MTPYHTVFFPIFLVGFTIALLASFIAGRKSGCLVPGILLCVGVCAFWFSLFLGSDLGYRAWQAMPDPPEEAFKDSGPVGALFLGWLPACFLCSLVYCISYLIRRLMSPKPAPSTLNENSATFVESGNPYQPR